jgi:5-methylcytosine-specific restriction endonuclease McrA
MPAEKSISSNTCPVPTLIRTIQMSKENFLKNEAMRDRNEQTVYRSTRRQFFSTSVRLNLFLKRKGACSICLQKIDAGKAWDIDHTIPLALGGTNETKNLQILCKPCHRSKTSNADIPAIAKTKRIKAHHLGARSPPLRPIPGSRRSLWKRKMDGSVVRRRP